MDWRKPPQASAEGLARIVIYLVAIASPPVLAATFEHGRHSGHRFIPQMANNVGLVGYTLLAFQFILAARLKWVERPFGLDMVVAFQRAMGVLAGLLLVAHPLLLAREGKHRPSLLYRLDVPWPIHVGRIALLSLVTVIFLSIFRKAIRLEYERWRAWHNVLVLSVLVLGFVHSRAMGDLHAGPMRLVWDSLFGMAVITVAKELERLDRHPKLLASMIRRARIPIRLRT